jgi:hypothetical protein
MIHTGTILLFEASSREQLSGAARTDSNPG